MDISMVELDKMLRRFFEVRNFVMQHRSPGKCNMTKSCAFHYIRYGA